MSLKYNKKNYKVLTDTGFRDFAGIALMNNNADMLEILLNGSITVKVSRGHKFLVDGQVVLAKDLKIGDKLSTIHGDKLIVNITPAPSAQTYDLIEVDTNQYYGNLVLSHNCEFISSDAILIDSYVITQAEKKIKKHEPAFTIKEQEFWHNINQHGTYLVGVDPSTGSGSDYSVITVYEFPSMKQVMEYRENTVSSPFMYSYLKNLLVFLTSRCREVYFSVENNGVGNGILSLYEADEAFPDRAYLVSESTATGYKLGFFTTAPAKMRACLRLKQMFESGNIHVYSNDMLTELKSYKRKRGAYEAESGATDDSISATLIVMRMLEEMAEYDERAYYKLYTANIDLGEAWDNDDDNDDNGSDDGYSIPFLL